MEEKQERKAIPELSIDTQIIQRVLEKAEVGQVITYAELSESVHRNVQYGARHNLESARRRVLRESGLVFGTVSNVGVKRLDDEGIVALGPHSRKKIGREANRTRRKLAQIQDFDRLPNEKKLEHNISASVLGMVNHITKEPTQKKLAAVIKNSEALPMGKMLEAIKRTL